MVGNEWWKFCADWYISKIGIRHKELGVHPEIFNWELEHCPSTDHDFDESELKTSEEPNCMSSSLLLSEKLKLHKQSVKCMDEGLVGYNDECPNGFTEIDNQAAKAGEALHN